MADTIISVVLEQLISIDAEEPEEELRLVTGVVKQVKKVTRNLRAIQILLADAEQRQVEEESVGLCPDQLKVASDEMEDVLDERIPSRLKMLLRQGVDDANAAAPKKPEKEISYMPARLQWMDDEIEATYEAMGEDGFTSKSGVITNRFLWRQVLRLDTVIKQEQVKS